MKVIVINISSYKWRNQASINMPQLLNRRETGLELRSLRSKPPHFFNVVIFGQWDCCLNRVKATTIPVVPVYPFFTRVLNQIVLNQIATKNTYWGAAAYAQGYKRSFHQVFWNFRYYQFLSIIIKIKVEVSSYSEPQNHFFLPEELGRKLATQLKSSTDIRKSGQSES